MLPVTQVQNCPLMLRHGRRRETERAWRAMYLTPFHVWEQSILDDTLQDICTEANNFMSRRSGRYERRKAKREANRLQRSLDVGGLSEVFTYHDLYSAGQAVLQCCTLEEQYATL